MLRHVRPYLPLRKIAEKKLKKKLKKVLKKNQFKFIIKQYIKIVCEVFVFNGKKQRTDIDEETEYGRYE